MTKKQFIKEMAHRGNIRICEADKLFNLFIDTLKEVIKEEGVVKLKGFGKFFVKEYKEKMMKNPKTDEPVKVPQHKKVRFAVSEVFNDSLNE